MLSDPISRAGWFEQKVFRTRDCITRCHRCCCPKSAALPDTAIRLGGSHCTWRTAVSFAHYRRSASRLSLKPVHPSLFFFPLFLFPFSSVINPHLPPTGSLRTGWILADTSSFGCSGSDSARDGAPSLAQAFLAHCCNLSGSCFFVPR